MQTFVAVAVFLPPLPSPFPLSLQMSPGLNRIFSLRMKVKLCVKEISASSGPRPSSQHQEDLSVPEEQRAGIRVKDRR